MNTDIRLSVDFWDHPKTLKLERKMGLPGVSALLRLWCWAGKYRPTGFLSDMDSHDAAIAARWKGSPEDFVSSLIEIGWIDSGEILYLHDWNDHQTWAIGAPERSERARKAANIRHRNTGEHAVSMPSACGEHASSNAQSMLKPCPSAQSMPDVCPNAPSPSPLPTSKEYSPNGELSCSPEKPGSNDGAVLNGTVPYKAIIEHLNLKSGKKFDHKTKETRRHILARWKEGRRLTDFHKVIDLKCSKWGSDPKFIDFIRPQTLFGPKFEAYLNETTSMGIETEEEWAERLKRQGGFDG